MVMEYDYIEEGTTIATMEHLDKPLVSVLFVSDEEAKKIEPGMDVQVSPSIVKKEENGFIRGKVIHVSNYPTTRQQMTSMFGNEQMTNYFMAGNVIPLIIIVKLDSDPVSKSGYKWSSGKEPDFKITSGTICNASIIITQMHPISVIFPYAN
jgi:HlyD family secretion protein